MDKQVRKLKNLVNKYLHKTRKHVVKDWKNPLKESDNDILFFRKHWRVLFWDEIAFIFEEDKVTDIVITEYLLGIELRCIYFYEYQSPEYKVVNSF